MSIVVPAFNSSEFLRPTLDSVLSQTLENWEMVVVDDGSADNTADIVRGYARRHKRLRLAQQFNAGMAASRNGGYYCANPALPYLMFLDHHDVLFPGALEVLIRCAADDVHRGRIVPAALQFRRSIGSWVHAFCGI